MVDESRGRPLKTLERALRIVEVLHERGEATASEVFEATSLSQSAVYNYLKTLEREGYVVRDDGTYCLSFRFLNLGESVRLQVDGLSTIENVVGDLTQEIDEEVDFVVEDHGRVMPIAELYHTKNYYNDRTSMPVRRAGVGTYYFMHTTASGKALLAEHHEGYVHDVVDRWGLPAQTDNSITDRAALLEELTEIRRRGYAITDGEFTEGNRSIAMAVTSPDDDPIGSLAITGPTYRLREENLHDYLPSMLEERVTQIESTLGG